MTSYLRGLRFVVRNHRAAFATILLSALTSSAAMALLNPLFLKWIFDEGIIRKDFDLFVLVSVGFMAVATLWRLLDMLIGLRLQRLKDTILEDLTTGLLQKSYRLPYEQVHARGAAYYAARAYDEPREATGAALDLALSLGKSVVVLAVSLAVAVALSPKVTVILILAVPPLLYLAARYGSVIERQSGEEKEKEGELRDYLSKAVLAHRVVRLFALQPRVVGGYRARLEGYVRSAFARCRSTCLHNLLGNILISYQEMLLVVVCGYEVLCDRMTFGGLMAFMQVFWIAVGALRALTQGAPEVSKVNALVQRFRELESHDEAPAPTLSSAGRIELKRAGMSFGDKVVFSDLSFCVLPGEKVLLRGRNGCGKSTVANLIAGFLTPCRGVVRTIPLARLSASLTPHHFIPGTVRDNLHGAGLGPAAVGYLEMLTEQLDLVGCMGKSPEDLSAGQKKKVEVAMCLLKEADAYLFDEPLANADVESKETIMRLIMERARGKTLIVVMHGEAGFHAKFDRVIEVRHAPAGSIYQKRR